MGRDGSEGNGKGRGKSEGNGKGGEAKGMGRGGGGAKGMGEEGGRKGNETRGGGGVWYVETSSLLPFIYVQGSPRSPLKFRQ